MNTSIPTNASRDYDKEIDEMLAEIEEKLANIRRNREEGAKIMAESRPIAEQNVRDLEELRGMVARLK